MNNAFTNLSRWLSKTTGTKGLLALALGAGLVGPLATTAKADDGRPYRRDDRRWDDRDRRRDNDDVSFRLRIGGPARPEIRRERVWVEPEFRTVCERVWVEPVYREDCNRVWIEPVYRTVTERVWVPDRFEWRVIEERRYGRICRERVWTLVEPGHFETRTSRVLECAGRWDERRTRVVVTEGYYKNLERQEIVREGGWDYREVRERRDNNAEFSLRIKG